MVRPLQDGAYIKRGRVSGQPLIRAFGQYFWVIFYFGLECTMLARLEVVQNIGRISALMANILIIKGL